MKLNLDKITMDGGTQSRAALDEFAVSEYAEAYLAGHELPKPIVFSDGSAYWLASGWHRLHAARTAGLTELDCDVRQGTRRDAVLCSVGENHRHGVRRTNADKQKCVSMVLADAEWNHWSDRKIADLCGVRHVMVAAIRNPERRAQQQAARQKSAERSAPPAAEPRAESAADVSNTLLQMESDSKCNKVQQASTGKQGEVEDDVAEDVAALLEELNQENAALRSKLKSLEADDLNAEVLKWRKVAEATQRGLDDAGQRAAESVEREKWAMRQLRRCGKAVGEDDPAKVAAKVEAMARAKGAAKMGAQHASEDEAREGV